MTRKRRTQSPELGLSARQVQNIEQALNVPMISVVKINPGDPAAADFRDHFPSIEFLVDKKRNTTLPSKAQALLMSAFGDEAEYTQSDVLPQQLRSLQERGISMVVQLTPLHYRRRFFSTEGAGFRIISTIPAGLMWTSDEKAWWNRVIEGIQAVGKQVV